MRKLLLICCILYATAYSAFVNKPHIHQAGNYAYSAWVNANDDTAYGGINSLHNIVTTQYMKKFDYENDDSSMSFFRIDTAYIDSATINLLSVDSITTNNATITFVDIQSGTIDTLSSNKLTSAVGTITTLDGTTSTYTTVNATNISSDSIYSDKVEIGTLTIADSLYSTAIESQRLYTDSIISTARFLEDVNFNKNVAIMGQLAVDTLSQNLRLLGTIDVDGAATLATVDINAGSIDATTIGATTASTGTFTTISADSINTTTIESQRARIDTVYPTVLNTPTINGELTSNGVINATAANTGHGDNELYPMDESVLSTADKTYNSLTTTTTINAVGNITAAQFTSGIVLTELYAMDQNIRSSDNVAFVDINATGNISCLKVNTGNGLYELYAMNQDVQSTDAPTFAGLTLTGALGGTSAIFSGSVVVSDINSGNGATEIYDMDQDIKSTDDVEFADLTINSLQALSKVHYQTYPVTFPVLMLSNGPGTISFGYDPSSNSYTGFSGAGTEILLPVEVRYLQSNTAESSMYNVMTLKDGSVGINTKTPDADFEVAGASTQSLISGSSDASILIKDEGSSANYQVYGIRSSANIMHIDRLSNDGSSTVATDILKIEGDSVIVANAHNAATYNSGNGPTEIPVYTSGSFACTLYNEFHASAGTATAYYQKIGDVVTITIGGTLSTSVGASPGLLLGYLSINAAPASIKPDNTSKEVHTAITGFVSNFGSQIFDGQLQYEGVNPWRWNFDLYYTDSFNTSTATGYTVSTDYASFTYRLY